MKSDIVSIERWPVAQPQRDDTKCSAHGKKWCDRDLVAEVYLKNDLSPRIHWRAVCQHWLDNEPKAADHS